MTAVNLLFQKQDRFGAARFKRTGIRYMMCKILSNQPKIKKYLTFNEAYYTILIEKPYSKRIANIET